MLHTILFQKGLRLYIAWYSIVDSTMGKSKRAIKKTAVEKEWDSLLKKESSFLQKRAKKKDSVLNRKLEEKIPEKLQATLDITFEKAFALVFEKGTSVIEKTYNSEEIKIDHDIQQYTADLKQNRKSLQVFAKKAGRSGVKNLMISGVSGLGLGVLGIGIPDIPLFTGMILKNIYEIALNYGYGYETDEEKLFILLLIQGAVSYGDEMLEINETLDKYMTEAVFPEPPTIERQIKTTAGALSKELLYMKFLQGIPIVGVIGGAYDAIYMNRITEYTQLKYRKRFLRRQNQK